MTELTGCRLPLMTVQYQLPVAINIYNPNKITPFYHSEKLYSRFFQTYKGDDRWSDGTTRHNCSKLTHVGFLKVHKAGSTTMQNMFFRFGLKHRLRVVLPTEGNYLAPEKELVVPDKSTHFDIIACHTVYDRQYFDSLLPEDNVKIAIVREPFERTVSAAYYYRDVFSVKYLSQIPQEHFIKNLVNYPDRYETSFFSRTRNSMAEDFGFSSYVKQNDRQLLEQYLQKLESEFSFVLVTERFDESLVLMRRLLRWSLADIVYLPSNAHAHKIANLTDEEFQKFRSTSFMDYAIYEFFVHKFERIVKEAGKDLQNEVKFFKTVIQRVKRFCDDSKKSTLTSLVVRKSRWDKQFEVTRDDCAWMETKEITFIDKLKNLYVSGHDFPQEQSPIMC